MIVLGFAPVVYLGMKDVGGGSFPAGRSCTNRWSAWPRIPPSSTPPPMRVRLLPDAWTSAWQPLIAGPSKSDGRGRVCDGFRTGFRAGLRVLVYEFPRGAARHGRANMTAARRTPLIGAVPKDATARPGHLARHDRYRPDCPSLGQVPSAERNWTTFARNSKMPEGRRMKDLDERLRRSRRPPTIPKSRPIWPSSVEGKMRRVKTSSAKPDGQGCVASIANAAGTGFNQFAWRNWSIFGRAHLKPIRYQAQSLQGH